MILQQLNNHLSSNNLLHPFQPAYHSNHSTDTILLNIVNDSLLSSDSKKVSFVTLLELSAAFDTIDHTILLTHLEYMFGIHNTALAWFKSYLYSWFKSVSHTQGSVLVPVLFTLYTTLHHQLSQLGSPLPC